MAIAGWPLVHGQRSVCTPIIMQGQRVLIAARTERWRVSGLRVLACVTAQGIFVELYPDVDGFCHISELSDQFVRNIDDAQVAVGDSLDVRVTEVNNKGQYRVVPTSKIEVISSGGGGGGRGGGRGRGGRSGGAGRGGRGGKKEQPVVIKTTYG